MEAFPQVAQKLLGVVFVLEADHAIVTVPHDDDVSPCVPAAPWAAQRSKTSCRERFARSGRALPPWGVPSSCCRHCPSSSTPALSHLRMWRTTRWSPIRCSTNFTSHSWSIASREATNVGIEYPVDVALFHPDRDRIQRMVRAASWAGTGREAEKLFLVDGVEHLDCRPLDDFVFQRRLADGALAPIRLSGWRRARPVEPDTLPAARGLTAPAGWCRVARRRWPMSGHPLPALHRD